MTLITLTTDFGNKDFYVARLKGLMLSQLEFASIVDVTHHIKQFDIQSAAFQLKHTWKSFPQYSIHMVWVGDQLSARNFWIACKYQQHFFVLPNNGLITLILESAPEQVVQLTKKDTNQAQDEFLAQCIAQIAEEQSILGVGEHNSNYLERLPQKAVVSGSLIRGTVQHVDQYGNLITNIDQQLFFDQRKERDFEIITRSIQFNRIRKTYSRVEAGEKLALFNSQGLLQFSINHGNAAQLFGLKAGDSVQIEFL